MQRGRWWRGMLGAVLLVGAVSAGAIADDWWEVRGEVPSGWQFWGAAVMDGRIFVFGTLGASKTSAWEFIPGMTPTDDRWEELAQLPAQYRSYFRAVALGGRIYIAGGSPGGQVSSSELWLYDPGDDGWSQGASLPAAVNGYALAELRGKIYLSGGCCGNRSDIYIYDPASGWTTSPVGLSQARNTPAGVAAGEKFLTIAGYVWPSGPRLGIVDAYVSTTGTIETWPPMSTPRDSHTASVCGDSVFVVGGNYYTNLPVEVLDLSTRTWSTTAPTPVPVGWGSSVVFDGMIWVFPLEAGVPVQVLHADACDLPPVARTGPDQAAREGDRVCLSGEGSWDPDGEPLIYRWVQIAGPPVHLQDPESPTPCFVAPPVPFGGATVTFALVVCDARACSNPASVNVTVSDIPHPPCPCIEVQSSPAHEGTRVMVRTCSWDPDDDPLTCTWSQVSGPPFYFDDPFACETGFIAPEVGPTGDSVEIRLDVSDGNETRYATAVVEIVNDPRPPVCVPPADQTKRENEPVLLDGCASQSPEGGPLQFLWESSTDPSLVLADAGTCAASFVAPWVPSGGRVLTFRLTVTDSLSMTSTCETQVTVTNAGDPPRCDLARAFPDILWPPNHKLLPVEIQRVSDPENDPVYLVISAVTQDEPLNGTGDGDTSPDARWFEDDVLLRAERAAPLGNGRVYRIHFQAWDVHGESCTGSVTVCVPLGNKGACMDDGQNYSSPPLQR